MAKIVWTKAKQNYSDRARLLSDDASLATFNLAAVSKRNVRQEKAERSKKARLEAKLRLAFEHEKAVAQAEAAVVARSLRDTFFITEQRLLNEHKLPR